MSRLYEPNENAIIFIVLNEVCFKYHYFNLIKSFGLSDKTHVYSYLIT